MKKNYLKSIGLVLLGGILSTFIFSFSPNEPSFIENHKEQNKSWVHFEKAQQDIAAYQMWLKFLPKTVKLDYANKKIIFQDAIDISEADFKALIPYLIRYRRNESAKDKTNEEIIDLLMENPVEMPFHGNLNYSYYISREDIDNAFYSDRNATGINVYLAMKGLDSMKLEKLESHLYVVPAQKVNDATLSDQLVRYNKSFFALDLTEPCPNLCDTNSPLYKPTLK